MGKVRIRSRYRGRIPQNIAESAVTADVNTIDVTGVGGEDYPNEPVGMTQVYHHTCDALPGAGSTATEQEVVAGGSWTLTSATGFDTISDPTAPVNGPTVLRMLWPSGLVDGNGPSARFDCIFGRSYKELYVSYHFKLPGAGSPSGWEMQGTTTKMLGYLSYGKTNRRNQFFMWFNPLTFAVDSEPGPWSTKSDFTNEYGGPDISQNVNTAKLIALGWNQMELYFKLNDDGVANGVHRVWVNGTLVIERTNVTMVGSAFGTTNGFYQLHFHPIWGGVNGQVKTRDDYLYLADLYASGVEQ